MPGINPMMITPQMHAEIMRRLAQQGMVDYQPYDPTSDYQNLGQTYLQGLQGANQAAQAPVSTSFRDIAPAGLGVILAALGNAVSKGQYPNLPIQIGQTADNRYQQRLQERGPKAQRLATQAEAQYNVGLQGIRSKQQASENQLQARKAVLDYLADLAKTKAQQEHWGAMEKRLGQGKPLSPTEARLQRQEQTGLREKAEKKGGERVRAAKDWIYDFMGANRPEYYQGYGGFKPSWGTVENDLRLSAAGTPYVDPIAQPLLDTLARARSDSAGIVNSMPQGQQAPAFMPQQTDPAATKAAAMFDDWDTLSPFEQEVILEDIRSGKL